LEEAFEGREAKLRARAAILGWVVHRVITENDIGADGQVRPSSAWKRKKITTPSGKKELRVIRPGFREVLDDILTGRVNAVLVEDLDRLFRQPRDVEDLLDACEMTGASAQSLTGSLQLTDGGTSTERYMVRSMVNAAVKSSDDTARRVADARERLNGSSYQGGPRPFGFVHAQETEKYHRTLIMVPDEADVIRAAAADILDKGLSARSVATDLRDRGIPTAQGKQWDAWLLKRVLTKPAVAGLAVHKGELKPAPWPAIIEPEMWEKLTDRLNDPARRQTVPGSNEPRHLLSGIALCGICNDGTTVRATGRRDRPFYVCRGPVAHLKRQSMPVDEYVEGLIVARLSKDDVRDILKPLARYGVDTAALKAEAKKLRTAKASQIDMHALGEIDDDDLKRGMRKIRDRLAVVEAQISASDEPDPLAEFRDKPADVVWKGLSLARKRVVLGLLADVTILPTAHRGRAGFDPDSVRIDRKV
jgi:DNA invertase Pin-like site-specific DNA recombinase